MSSKLLETWNKLPTAGKVAVGAGVVGVIVYVWKSGGKSSAPSLLPTLQSPTTYGDTGGGDSGSSGDSTWGSSTGDSGSGGSSGGSDSSGNAGSGSQSGSVTVPTSNPSPTTPVVVHPTHIDIGMASTPGFHSLPTHQTSTDVVSSNQWHSTVTDLTGNVNATDVSAISNTANTNIVRKPTASKDYTVAQGGSSYNGAVNGAGGQWLVGSDNKGHWYAGQYTNTGVFVADKGTPTLAGNKDVQIRGQDGKLYVGSNFNAVAKQAGGYWQDHKWVAVK